MLLLGAPERDGPAAVEIQILRDDHVLFDGEAVTLDVTTDDAVVARAARHILEDPSPVRAMHRLGWLREQGIARYGMTMFHRIGRALVRDDVHRRAIAGRNVLRLRWNARLATFEHVSDALRRAEVEAARRVFALCPVASDDAGLATRVACIGRVADELRRFGYLDVSSRIPEVARDLARGAREVYRMSLPTRYETLVGLMLAEPEQIAWHRDLLSVRRELASYPTLPAMP